MFATSVEDVPLCQVVLVIENFDRTKTLTVRTLSACEPLLIIFPTGPPSMIHNLWFPHIARGWAQLVLQKGLSDFDITEGQNETLWDLVLAYLVFAEDDNIEEDQFELAHNYSTITNHLVAAALRLGPHEDAFPSLFSLCEIMHWDMPPVHDNILRIKVHVVTKAYRRFFMREEVRRVPDKPRPRLAQRQAAPLTDIRPVARRQRNTWNPDNCMVLM